jgi:hypothetical protein
MSQDNQRTHFAAHQSEPRSSKVRAFSPSTDSSIAVEEDCIDRTVAMETPEQSMQLPHHLPKARRWIKIDYSGAEFDCFICNGNCLRRRQCCRDSSECTLLDIDQQMVTLIFSCATAQREVKVNCQCEKHIDLTYGFKKVLCKKPYMTLYSFEKSGYISYFSDYGATQDIWPRWWERKYCNLEDCDC